MKKTFEITLEVPDTFEVLDVDYKKADEDETIQFVNEWKESIKNYFLNIEERIKKEEIEPFLEFYNESGELPPFKIVVKELEGGNDD